MKTKLKSNHKYVVTVVLDTSAKLLKKYIREGVTASLKLLEDHPYVDKVRVRSVDED